MDSMGAPLLSTVALNLDYTGNNFISLMEIHPYSQRPSGGGLWRRADSYKQDEKLGKL